MKKAERERQRKSRIANIVANGNQPRFCICCGEIIGEVLDGNIIATEWYENHAVCIKGHVCKKCMHSCRGFGSCRYEELNKQ